MEVKSIHTLCNIKPFIEYEIELGNGKLQLEGHEYYCIDLLCNCKLVNIMIHEVGSGEKYTQLVYGWRPYKHYAKQQFLKSDCESMIKGVVSLNEDKTHLNKIILAGFQNWLRQNKKEKDKIFAKRYDHFRQQYINLDLNIINQALSEHQLLEALKSLNLSDLIEIRDKMFTNDDDKK